MRGFPLEVSEQRRRGFESEVAAFEDRAEDAVDALLAEVEPDRARRQLDRLVFSANRVLPKRERRPGEVSMLSAYVVEQLHAEYGGDERRRETLVAVALAIQEYADIVDDLIDGDVAADRETEVLLTLQVLWPAIVRHLIALGPAEAAYWTERAGALVAAPVTERTREPSAETYLALVEQQGRLFGSVTGLAAVAAGEEDAVDDAERLGELFFAYTQFLLDCEQYDGTETWNALSVMSPAAVREQLEAWRDEFERRLERLSAERARRLEPLVAVDLDAWDGLTD